MFDDMEIAFKQKNRTGVGIVISAVVQTLILGILILIPLIYTDALPKAFLTTLLVAPPPPPPPPPPQAMVKTIKPVKLIQSGVLVAPKAIPREVTVIREEAPDVPQQGVFGGLAGQGIMVGTPIAALPPPPPKAAAPVRIKQGGNVTAASIINQTRPVYPPLARQARIQGNVILHAIIDKDGRVAQLEVVSGHPLLVQAALDAVKQWLYKPTLLNGDPVEVDTTITVSFTMGG